MAADTSTGFVRQLGRWDALAIGFGAMIGFGWVVLTGEWLVAAGTLGAVLAFVVGGVIMALIGLTYAELVAAMPHAGGEHNYVMRAMGSRWAFVASWALVGGYVTIAAFEAVALPRTAAYLFPSLESVQLWSVAGSPVYLGWGVVGTLAAVALTAVNIVGIRPASMIQTFIVLFLVVIAGLMLVGAGVGGSLDHAEPLFTGGFGGFAAVLVVVPFLFVGFDVIPQSAEEIDLPFPMIGKLIVLSVSLAALFYIIIVGASGLAMDRGTLVESDLATADAMAALWGSDAFATVLVAGGIAGILTSWNAFLIGGSRLLYALGRSGMMPAVFGRLHPRFRTPTAALLFIGALSAAAPWLGADALGWLVDSGSPSIVLGYLLVTVAFLVLRRREPGMDRPLRIGGAGGGGVGIGVVALVLTAGLATLYLPGMPSSLPAAPWVLFGLWWLLGVLLLIRVPSVSGGPDAEERVLSRLSRT
ncbi:APC family permease [Serinicoccus kebangsaanensis]|uniref:APC family permease n=1 Tax=Serinicoccus kebangsaanensis TaxID=2602069 RepID=UPI00124EE977|nr:APC family permease [Serinicoccus kebangsaanensis]